MPDATRDGPGQRDIIHIVDDNLRKGFAQVPRPVLRACGLSVKAKLVYVLLLDYAWQDDSCFPGQDTMAADLDVSVDTVQRALKELRAYQLVDWKQLGLNRPNIYYILRLSDCPNLDLGSAGNRKLRFPETAAVRHPETAICGTKNTQLTIPKTSKTAIPTTSKSYREQPSNFRKGSRPGLQEENLNEVQAPERVSTLEERVAARAETVTGSAARRGMNRIGDVLRQKQVPGAPAGGTPVLPDYRPSTTTKTAPPPEALATRGATSKEGMAAHRTNVERQALNALDQSGTTAHQATRRSASRISAQERQSIQAYLGDFAPELGDQAPFKSSVTRVANIYADSGLTMTAFIQRMYSARSRTKERYTAIHDRTKRFAYFCALLEEESGLREPPPEIAAAAQERVATQATEAADPPERKSLAGKYAHLVRR